MLTLGSKFLLSIYIVKVLGLETNGEYGIFLTTVTFLTYILGLDFYSYSTRDILQGEKKDYSSKVQNQFLLFGAIYIIALPVFSLIWCFDFINSKYILLFYVLLILEHISTELYRLLVVFSKPVLANWNLFLRSGIWIVCLLACWLLNYEQFKNLESILWFWMFGSFASIIISLIAVSRLGMNLFAPVKVEKKWIKKGVVVALPFFVGTISYKIIQFSDRYMVDYFLGTFDAGIYIFFANISMLIETFVQTTVLMIYSPKLIKSFSDGRESFNKVYKKFSKELILYTLVAVFGVLCLIYPLLIFVEKNELLQHLDVFVIMVITRLIFNISLLYHFYLYVTKNDKIIMNSTLLAVVLNIVLNVILIPILGMNGSAFATLIGFLVILLLKFRFAKKYGL